MKNNNIFEGIISKINSMTYVGIGYVIIPTDVNKDEYIQYCYLNESVSILPETGGVCYNNVKVSVNCLNDIEFPEKDNFGSCVVYLLHPTQKIPIIIGVISKHNESVSLNYKLFKLFKSKGNNSVSVCGDGSNGNLMINVVSEEQDGGQIVIDVNHYNETGVLRLRVKGDIFILTKNIEIEVSGNFKIKSKNFSLESDEFLLDSKKSTIKGKKLSILNNSVEIGENNLQSAVMGETLKNNIINPLIETLKTFSMIVSGPAAVVSPETIAKLKPIQESLDNLLSNKLKIE